MTDVDQKCADGKTPDLHPAQIEAYRRMSPAEKLSLIGRTYWQARHLKESGLRHQHPDWTDAEIEKETRRIFVYANTG